MTIKQLQSEDSVSLNKLISIIEQNLKNPEYWLPINDISKNHFFDKEWTDFYGMFDNGELIGAVALFYNEHEFKESVSHINMELGRVAEIGRAMVHPDYRGKGLLSELNSVLVEQAKKKNIDYLLATIHPENLPSQQSFKKLGMKKYCTYTKNNGFLRDVYLLKI